MAKGDSKPKNEKPAREKKDPRDTYFKKGNKVWELAKNAGRPKKHKTAQELWEAACDYFQWAQDTPIPNWVISGGKRVWAPLQRPFTLYGLCIFMGVSSRYITDIEDRVLDKTDPTTALFDEKEAEFSQVITCIREIIYNQKFEGAAVGMFKENLIARDLGIHESVNQKMWSGDDNPLPNQIQVFQIPDNGRAINYDAVAENTPPGTAGE